MNFLELPLYDYDEILKQIVVGYQLCLHRTERKNLRKKGLLHMKIRVDLLFGYYLIMFDGIIRESLTFTRRNLLSLLILLLILLSFWKVSPFYLKEELGNFLQLLHFIVSVHIFRALRNFGLVMDDYCVHRLKVFLQVQVTNYFQIILLPFLLLL